MCIQIRNVRNLTVIHTKYGEEPFNVKSSRDRPLISTPVRQKNLKTTPSFGENFGH